MYQGINYGNVGLGRGELISHDLVVDAQPGDRAAFQEIVKDYEMVVMQVALNLTGSAEAAQDIYCRVFRDTFVSISELRPGSSAFIWVYRILARHGLEYCQRHPPVKRPDCSDGDFGSRLRSAILTLKPTERVILQLKQYQGLKIRTLAEIFDATPEFIIDSLQNANTHLRRQLEADCRRPL